VLSLVDRRASSLAPPLIHRGRQRAALRYSVAVPVDVTMLKSGIPDCVPGRSLNLSTSGMAAVFAAELRPGETVGVEFRLPDVAVRVRAKAIVRYQSRLRCGLEFRSLSPEEVAILRYWTEHKRERERPQEDPISQALAEPSKKRRFPMAALVCLLVCGVVTVSAGWWHWQTAWQELESQIPGMASAIPGERMRVPASEMEALITHRVEAAYPEEARLAKLHGTVILNAVVGRDGSVVEVRPVAGPNELSAAAADAVRWWRFQPYLRNGAPAEVETTITVDFRP